MEKFINALFTTEKGRFDKTKNEFVDRKETAKERIIKMRIEERCGKKCLRFIHGPTGHESYYLDDLIDGGVLERDGDTMCICGGTINRWPRCEVSLQEVQIFIRSTFE